jgi:hypothetical protein
MFSMRATTFSEMTSTRHLLDVLQDGLDPGHHPRARARDRRQVGMDRRPRDLRRRVLRRVEVVELQVEDAGESRRRQPHPETPGDEVGQDLARIARHEALEGLGKEGDDQPDPIVLRVVVDAGELDLLEAADRDAAELHRRADVQPLHRLVHVRLGVHLGAHERPRAEDDHGSDDHRRPRQDEGSQLEVRRLRAHADSASLRKN